MDIDILIEDLDVLVDMAREDTTWKRRRHRNERN
jgi:hypothetical protein